MPILIVRRYEGQTSRGAQVASQVSLALQGGARDLFVTLQAYNMITRYLLIKPFLPKIVNPVKMHVI
jgi:hypothetical protein